MQVYHTSSPALARLLLLAASLLAAGTNANALGAPGHDGAGIDANALAAPGRAGAGVDANALGAPGHADASTAANFLAAPGRADAGVDAEAAAVRTGHGSRVRAAAVSGFVHLPRQEEAAQDSAEEEEDEGLPLDPARTISFTTDEASWMSVDVSPDGETIVFDLLGDLYLLPIEGGQAQPLTSGMAFDAQPRFGPAGDRIVFISDRSGGDNVWTIAVDGSDTLQVTEGNDNLYTSPEWTPDGDYIVASRTEGLGGAAKLWLYHIEGGSGAQLIGGSDEDGEDNDSDVKMLGAAFGPDPRYVWFGQRNGDWEYNAILPEYQVAVYDRRTGTRTAMSARYGSAFRPALSPDGRWLVYGSRHDEYTGLRVRDLATGEERWLAYPVQRDDQESRATLDVLPGYSFTPDSRAVVVSYGGELWSVPVDGGEATRIPFTADVALEVGPTVDFEHRVDAAPAFTVRQIRDAVPSPDGQRLAFTALDRLYVVDVPDGEPRRLTEMDVGEHQPTWSPDGQQVAYVSWSDTEGGHIYKVPAEGGDPERLTNTAGYYQQPAWSPDGERLVAIRAAARGLQQETGTLGAEFVQVSAQGGEVTVIAPTGGRSTPHFTSDPDRIYAYSSREGLVSFRWDGTDVRHHVQVRGATLPGNDEPMRASLVLMAPEGDRALAQVVNDLYVVTVPLVGDEAPTISVADPEGAAFPVRKLTTVGGQFPAWSRDGGRVHWSIGNAHFVYDLARAEAVDDSLTAAADAEPAGADEEEAAAEDDEEAGYQPVEFRVRVTAQRDIPQGVAVLRGARIITMRGDEVIEEGDVVVRGNRIAAVGPTGQVEVPDGAEVIDAAGTTIIPGFVDTHAHLRPPFGIHKTHVWEYLANLAYGVTTTRDPQTGTTDVLAYGDLVETGELIGPRIYSTGPGVFLSEQIESLDHARDVLERYAEYYGTKTIKMYMSGNREQRQWIIMAARELEIMPTTEGGLDYKLNLTHVIDGYSGLEHALPIYPLYGDVLRLFTESDITYTPTLLVSYGGPFGENYYYATEQVHDNTKLRRFTPHNEIDAKARRRGDNPGPGGWFMREEYVFDDHARFVADLVEAGGRAGVGSHGQLQGLGYHWELWSMQSGGLSEHDALRVATTLGAEAIGFAQDLGTVEAGKLADLVVLNENPLVDIRNTTSIRYVMKNGRLYEGDTLNEIWPRQRPLPQPFLTDTEPGPVAGVR